jgi:hypothetical protein
MWKLWENRLQEICFRAHVILTFTLNSEVIKF